MMPGKSGAPALRRVTRLSLSSCLTDLLVYPLARSSPTVLGLVTRTLCREVPNLSIAGLARCWCYVKMSWGNGSVKVSSPHGHGHGDARHESQGDSTSRYSACGG